MNTDVGANNAEEESLATLESSLEAITVPSTGLYVNFDVNDYLETHSTSDMFVLLGQLKDLLDA